MVSKAAQNIQVYVIFVYELCLIYVVKINIDETLTWTEFFTSR